MFLETTNRKMFRMVTKAAISKYSLVFVFCLLFSLEFYAGGIEKYIAAPSFRNPFIKTVSSDFGISADYNINFTNFALFDDNNERRFSYYPNLRGILTVGARYKIFRASYSFDLWNTEQYNEFYGPTSYRNIEFGIKTRLIWLQLYYSEYRGFYSSQENILFPKFTLDSIYPQNPNLSSFEIGLKTNVIFHNDFSMEAAFDYSEIQTESAGSLFLFLNPEISNLKSNNSDLIPSVYKQYYSDLKEFDKALFVSLAFGLGYGYSIILGPINFSNAVVAAPNIQMYFNDGIRLKLPVDLFFKSSLSFNVKNFYTGAMCSLDINNLKFGNNIIRKQLLNFAFRMGVRF